jgi:hypothetical protein
MLRENALLLYMMRKEDEVFNIENTFKRMNIDYLNKQEETQND